MTEWQKIRKKNNMTQKEISNYLGISQSVYSRYENNKRFLPIKLMIKILKMDEENYYDIINLLENGKIK